MTTTHVPQRINQEPVKPRLLPYQPKRLVPGELGAQLVLMKSEVS